MNRKQKNLLIRIVIAAVFFVPLYLISEDIVPVKLSNWIVLVLFLIPYLTVGYDILGKAAIGIRNKQVFDENFLMSIATIGAIVLGEYGEGVAVMLLYQVGELFQSYAVGKSRRNISDLMDIRPDYANIEVNGKPEQVDPEDVEIGTIIMVQPGEKVPIDGVIVEGISTLNTGALTGESKPVDVAEGESILSGSINMTGVLKVRTTTEFHTSTASKILDLVENASSRKSESEKFISKFARVYTPVIVCCALALAILPPLFVMITKVGMGSYETVGALWTGWTLRACTFLVISCPCAVVISIPLSFFAGIGGAGKQGILVKGSDYLETLSDVRTVVFDKTGTITKGSFEVTGIHHSPLEEKTMLAYAALAESHSSHPISLSLQQAYAENIDQSRVTRVKEISGYGISAIIDGRDVIIGNEKMMRKAGVEYRPCSHTGTIIHMAVAGEYVGHIVISDRIKPTSKEAIAALKKAGIEKIVMLTGDKESVAKRSLKKNGTD